MRCFLFAQSHRTGRGFKLAVHAKSLPAARRYVKNESLSVVAYRTLKYLGEGPPSDPENWCATIVRSQR
jgi:hypothetical protein